MSTTNDPPGASPPDPPSDAVAEARALVAAMREAEAQHGEHWRALVPSADIVNAEAEAGEDAAFAAMRAARARVAAHICRLYGIDAETLKRVARA